MLDDFGEKYRYKSKRSPAYVDTINDAILQLNDISSPTLATITSHKFYNTIRNLSRDLLLDWHSAYKLNLDETFLLRNCVLLLNRLVMIVEDITMLTPWLLDPLFINAIAYCMNDIDQLLSIDKEKKTFKQLTRFLDLFDNYYQRLPSNLQNDNALTPLFEATMNCLVSSKYDRIFRKLKSNTQSMTREEKFFLIQCPSFLASNHGTQSSIIIQQLLETMIPRYASILDKQIKSINEWSSVMFHCVHHLLLTVVNAKDQYTLYANGQPLQWLIDHIVCIISEPTIVNKVNGKSITPETLLIDSALKTLTAFIREPDLLVYIKQLKITSIFRSLIFLPYESIVFHVYMLLSYTLEEDDIKASEKDSGRLLSNILDSLRKKINSFSKTSKNEESNQQNIAILVEAVRALVQHDQIKSEILKQNALSLLINNCQHFNDRSKRLTLESLGSITFDSEAARLLRTDTKFINSVGDMKKTTNDGVKKAAEKIIWNLIEEPEKIAKREKKTEKQSIKSDKSKTDEYQHDIMISYCHADKELVYRLQKFLADKGLKIWFDRDNMYGPAMEAMADAVENSEFVILCMSDSYKRSVYCQAEAEYAFQCKRRLLPLIVRQGYRPDGWLGLLIGSRIYIDFGRFDFKNACELLINEMTLQRKSQLAINATNGHTLHVDEVGSTKPLSTNDTIPLTSTSIVTMQQGHLPNEYINYDTSHSTYQSKLLNKWTKKDVFDFLYDSKLHLMMPLCESITGHGLQKLFRLCHTKPNRSYEQLNEELRSRFDGMYLPLGTFIQFLAEMEEIIDSSSLRQSIEGHTSPLKSASSSLIIDEPVKNTSVPSSPVKPNPTIFPRRAISSDRINMKTTQHMRVSEEIMYHSEPLLNGSPIRSEQIEDNEPELILIDEQARQLQQAKTVSFQKTSNLFSTKSEKKQQT